MSLPLWQVFPGLVQTLADCPARWAGWGVYHEPINSFMDVLYMNVAKKIV